MVAAAAEDLQVVVSAEALQAAAVRRLIGNPI
jgi:hypothetical protein